MRAERTHLLQWWLPPLLLLIVTAYGFVLASDGPASFDEPLLLWFRVDGDAAQLAGPGWMASLWLGLTWLGDAVPRTVVALSMVFGLLLLRRWQAALFIAAVLLSGIALSTALKHWVGRPRPQLVAPLDLVSSASFPSGHALNGTLFYLGVALMLARLVRHRGVRWVLYGAAIGLALATGISRIALGVHYPSDVIAGWIIGAAWLCLWFAAAERYWPQAIRRGLRPPGPCWPPRVMHPPQSEPPVPLAGVVAVIGSDGSGKSTLTADLVAILRGSRRCELLYLGQSSGNIGAWIERLPLIGGPLGRYLVRKSERAHQRKAQAPDFATALVLHLLSQWRAHKFRRMVALVGRGVLVVTDRYPQAEVPGFYFDGPGLGAEDAASWFVRQLALRELRLYQWMARHTPTLVIRLNIDAQTAHARKPDHKLSMLRDKAAVIPTLRFNGARILDLDARDPYPRVLEAALNAIRSSIEAAPGRHP